ncbi:STAS domain-containing protein [Saccharothrix coeruleofusca]|uniref:STAS domain-containing protein n=1 Tax=Saccharothrix coeruleofusca TaxID=33919 RepID=UPI001E283092|nr:STAS domain-containing protein [Saccharothrix coeruleofusca]MBP2337965.1 anti-anti-sigma factor [Saccharothrix coeruleofusca]
MASNTAGQPVVQSGGPGEQIGIGVERVGADVTVVAVTGEIDMLTAPRLRTEVKEQLSTSRAVVLDLSGVSFLGSAGLAVLVEASQQSERGGADFHVVAVARAVTRPLAATGLSGVFNVHPTVAAAVEAAGRG